MHIFLKEWNMINAIQMHCEGIPWVSFRFRPIHPLLTKQSGFQVTLWRQWKLPLKKKIVHFPHL